MIKSEDFIEVVAQNHAALIGVPCSNLSSVFKDLETTDLLRYIPATTEGEACAIAAGYWLAGKQAGVICQNSGLGNMVNPIASLCQPYQIPVSLFISMRGAVGFKDEAQHEIMGRTSGPLLELLGVKTTVLPCEWLDALAEMRCAKQELADRNSRAFLINPKTIENAKTQSTMPSLISSGERPTVKRVTAGPIGDRASTIAQIMEEFSNHAVIATTGYAYREAYKCHDKANNFYMAGSMGHASAIGLGVAMNCAHPVTVLDGDGALLMKMGNCATIGKMSPRNLTHVVLDNGIFESTGGQPSNANAVDFSGVALSCGYRSVWSCSGKEAVKEALHSIDPFDGPNFLHIRIAPLTIKVVERPKLDLPERALMFREHMVSFSSKFTP